MNELMLCTVRTLEPWTLDIFCVFVCWLSDECIYMKQKLSLVCCRKIIDFVIIHFLSSRMQEFCFVPGQGTLDRPFYLETHWALHSNSCLLTKCWQQRLFLGLCEKPSLVSQRKNCTKKCKVFTIWVPLL